MTIAEWRTDTTSRLTRLEDMLTQILGILQPPPPPPPPPSRFPGDPGVGNILYGESHVGGQVRDGLNVGIHRSYWQASQLTSAIAQAEADVAAGQLPVVSFKQPARWPDMAAGLHDDWLAQRRDLIAAVAGPVVTIDHHEPWDDRDGGPSGTNQGTPADFVAMNRHAMGFKAPNQSQCINLQSFPFNPNSLPAGNLAAIWDWFAADACDIAAMNAYNSWSINPSNGHKWRTPDELFTAPWTELAKLGKPIAVCEYGVRTDPANPGKAAQWLRDAFELFVGLGFVWASYFDSDQNVNDGGSPWLLDDQDTERLDAFVGLTGDPRAVHI